MALSKKAKIYGLQVTAILILLSLYFVVQLTVRVNQSVFLKNQQGKPKVGVENGHFNSTNNLKVEMRLPHVDNLTLPRTNSTTEFLNSTEALSTTTTTTTTGFRPNAEAATSPKVCSPQTNVFFLKTHKTASSSVLNILQRYADSHDLFIGLPNLGANLFRLPQFFKRWFIKQPKPGVTVNMIFHHMRFDYNEVKAVMPPNTTYITVLRDPATQFESAFHYFYRFVPSFQRASGGQKDEKSLEKFIDNPSLYFRGSADKQYWYVAKNFMSFDLGFNNLLDSDDYISSVIAEMEHKFDFVIIADYFDMSMVLLKDLLCWSLEDVLGFKNNARKTGTIQTLSSEVVQKIRAWNKLDAAIFDYFNKTFWKRVEAFGRDRMEKELYALQEGRKILQHVCLKKSGVENMNIKDPNYKVFNPPGVLITGFLLRDSVKTNEICEGLARQEMQWLKYTTEKQKDRTVIPPIVTKNPVKPVAAQENVAPKSTEVPGAVKVTPKAKVVPLPAHMESTSDKKDIAAGDAKISSQKPLKIVVTVKKLDEITNNNTV